MNIGDRVDISGFDVVAHADAAEGTERLLVAHNNSSHYHLFRQGHDDLVIDSIGGHQYGVFVATYPYHNIPESMRWMIYQCALIAMIREAGAR